MQQVMEPNTYFRGMKVWSQEISLLNNLIWTVVFRSFYEQCVVVCVWSNKKSDASLDGIHYTQHRPRGWKAKNSKGALGRE